MVITQIAITIMIPNPQLSYIFCYFVFVIEDSMIPFMIYVLFNLQYLIIKPHKYSLICNIFIIKNPIKSIYGVYMIH